jgi:hypothetical protein
MGGAEVGLSGVQPLVGAAATKDALVSVCCEIINDQTLIYSHNPSDS